MLFNRRRPGESSKIELEQYKRKQQIEKEEYENLTLLQKALAKEIQVFYIIGKRTRRLPILVLNSHCR